MWTMDSGSGYYPVSGLQPTESMSSKLATNAVGFQVGLIKDFTRFNCYFYSTCFSPHHCNALKIIGPISLYGMVHNHFDLPQLLVFRRFKEGARLCKMFKTS